MDNIKYQELVKHHNHHGRKLREYSPLNSTCKEFSDNYRCSNDRKSFYINSPCIVANKRTIYTGVTYLLLDLESDKDQIKESTVILIDAYYHNQSAHLNIMDEYSGI